MPALQPSREIYHFGSFEARLEDGTLLRNGHDILLQDQPFRLLVLLISRSGTVVTRDEIRDHLWPANTNVEFDKSLRVAVSKLREALRDSATQPIYIETIPRRGYRFKVPVTVLQPSPREALVSTMVAYVPEVSPTQETRAALTPPDRPHRVGGLAPSLSRKALWLASVAILFAASLYLIAKKPGAGVAPSVAAHPIARPSVAIISLRNLSGSPGDHWLATGLAEMLSTELSAGQRLRLISGEEVARAGLLQPLTNTPSHETLVRYANQLGADIIIYGSYTLTHNKTDAASSQMRLDLRVEDISSEAHSVSLVRTGRANDLFSLVSATGGDLRRHFGSEELSLNTASAVRRTLPSDPEAAKLYAEGLNRLRDFDAPGGRDLLLKAAHIEPAHAGTHLALADAWQTMGYLQEAKAEAARAVELGAGLPREELLTMQGELAVLSSDWQRAIDVDHALLTLYPDDIDTGLRLVAAQKGAERFSDAMATLRSLRRPGLVRAEEARLDLGEASANAAVGNFRQSIAPAEKVIAIATELDSHLLRAEALGIKAYSLERLGDAGGSLAASSEEQDLYRAANDKTGLARALLLHGDVLYDRGKNADARRTFLTALNLYREAGNPFHTALSLERIGNTYYEEDALVESRRYYEEALVTYRALHADSRIGGVLGNIANVQDTEGDIAGALRGDTECLALAEQAGDQREMASTLANMGALEWERGNLDQSAADFRRGAEIDQRITYARGLAHALVGEGDVLLDRNDVAGALRQYDLGARAIGSMDEPQFRVAALIGQGSAHTLLGNGDQGISLLNQAAATALQNKQHAQAVIALMWLSRSLLVQGRILQALDAANQAMAESQAQVSPQMRAFASLALARVMMAQGRIAPAQGEIRAALVLAARHGYLPLEMELRILLAEATADPNRRRSQLSTLARTADTHGWSRMASYARGQN